MNGGFSAILAMSENRVIGHEGKIPWHIREEFQWFKRCTLGHSIIMGRKTYESIGRPLPGRRNLVVSRNADSIEGVEIIRDPQSLKASDFLPGKAFVIGGRELLVQMLPRCDEFFLTVVHRAVEGDVFLPEFENEFPVSSMVLEHAEFHVMHFLRK